MYSKYNILTLKVIYKIRILSEIYQEKLTIYDFRFTIYDLQFTIYDLYKLQTPKAEGHEVEEF